MLLANQPNTTAGEAQIPRYTLFADIKWRKWYRGHYRTLFATFLGLSMPTLEPDFPDDEIQIRYKEVAKTLI